jgi:hypothetical protein
MKPVSAEGTPFSQEQRIKKNHKTILEMLHIFYCFSQEQQ